MSYLSKVKYTQPLVVCYTNDVVKNFTANGLLSIGASPAMSEAPEEAKDFFKVTNGLLINIGTLTRQTGQDMLEIAKQANDLGVPIVFDPVAVGASRFRKDFCKQFLAQVDVDVIKGNASEILTLVDDQTTMKGTDSDSGMDHIKIACEAYKKYNTAIIVTGEKDVIVQNHQVIELSNGSPLLTKITGSGCLLGAVVASFLLSQKKPGIEVLIEAVSIFNIAAEHAELSQGADLPGTFLVSFVNALNQVDEATYHQEIKKREVKVT
ncbi:hydroxyethylthiazole kinase [Staphylococcus hyicus]|uniref:Hydroxyethylthiazole kinase n=2 Tax=Staphylococcus hyicus TaxID=1284 RepID=A0ACD5FPA2_STAHY|nr:hydroxyethylthiazole kinase [Staphylococcus hyicus]AJC95559.1 hydroxyethylthiazole kinase [Staphylococcus hyicus]MCE5154911.1 hydroxyethylthiazole kinase [Staphylococcus hyicus]MCQ9292130.1 hydroxyethylthiazole kinase [Staphylococcus hyicus]MCQ9307371.1 hydroxyethylthiazole kinase [Staphylococcus hyicus]MCQ9309784.1 hydroxyethylthiazole kinase [Staphylococcus hyicus]